MGDYLLSDDDRALILAMARQLQRDQGQDNTGQRPRVSFDADDHPAPECYVAKAPAGGIPALMGPGGIGTGTVGDEPGMAMCPVYRLQPKPGSAGVVALEPLGRSKVQIWNLGLSAIAGNSWFLTARDKLGSWWAIPTAVGGSGGGAVIECVRPTSITPDAKNRIPGITQAYDVTRLPGDPWYDSQMTQNCWLHEVNQKFDFDTSLRYWGHYKAQSDGQPLYEAIIVAGVTRQVNFYKYSCNNTGVLTGQTAVAQITHGLITSWTDYA